MSSAELKKESAPLIGGESVSTMRLRTSQPTHPSSMPASQLPFAIDPACEVSVVAIPPQNKLRDA
eukprot:934217-Amphidinium_carterae.1